MHNLYLLLSQAFKVIPNDWTRYFIRIGSVVQVDMSIEDFNTWVRKEVFFYTSTYALLDLICRCYSMALANP